MTSARNAGAVMTALLAVSLLANPAARAEERDRPVSSAAAAAADILQVEARVESWTGGRMQPGRKEISIQAYGALFGIRIRGGNYCSAALTAGGGNGLQIQAEGSVAPFGQYERGPFLSLGVKLGQANVDRCVVDGSSCPRAQLEPREGEVGLLAGARAAVGYQLVASHGTYYALAGYWAGRVGFDKADSVPSGWYHGLTVALGLSLGNNP